MLGAIIIFTTTCRLSSLKNICSVRQRPIPWAPKSRARCASWALSAFAQTSSFLTWSANLRSVFSWLVIFGSIKCAWPKITSPLAPFREMISPSLITRLLIFISFLVKLTMICSQPAIQGLPRPRAITAAWLVMPPRAVKIPSAAIIPCTSLGLVSGRTKITFFFFWAHCSA